MTEAVEYYYKLYEATEITNDKITEGKVKAIMNTIDGIHAFQESGAKEPRKRELTLQSRRRGDNKCAMLKIAA